MNEDRMVVKELTEQLIYIGIFDGHCTSFAADYVLEYLEHHINYWLSRTDKLETVLYKSFVEVHNVLARHLAFYFMNSEVFMTGTTATVCLIRDSSEMVVGHVGDSRAVLCRKGSSVRLSVDHDPDDPDENQRVTKKGGRIIQNSQGISQVNGRLGMTRSIGDTEFKGYGVVAEPYIRSLEIKHGYDAFLVLATDGLSFVLSDNEMVNIISSCQTPDEAAHLLADQALHFGSEDNCSVIVVPFGAWGKYIAAAMSWDFKRAWQLSAFASTPPTNRTGEKTQKNTARQDFPLRALSQSVRTMASTRINEHMEACRKQRVIDKKAYYDKYVGERMYPGLDNNLQYHPTSDPERSYDLTQERSSYGENTRLSNAYPKIQQKLSDSPPTISSSGDALIHTCWKLFLSLISSSFL
ncbi:hypothetical protein C0Q70_01174 [Pomacea canaliculata]|uniref:PPM-type phosphatase domain-containing protein n=1 Tax=Pomacea canaliculata TaxID=400727 RepID=A0A2T7PYT0_POMCA|nr:hypothetical protein C0Q70_01174 [Pomacea canaliculata]